MNTNCIVAKNVTKNIVTKYVDIKLLTNINFSLEQGDSAAIIGISGSGKTTLLSILAGLDLPTTGSVIIKDNNLSELNEEQRTNVRAQEIGFVFQNFQLLSHMNVLENIMLPLELVYDKAAKQKALAILEKVGLSNRLNNFPYQLSGGEQQRVSIARAFVTEPKLLLADEPTGNLDEATGEKIIELLFKINAENNTTLILVTHDLNLAGRCSRKFTLEHGRLSEVQ